MKKVVVCVWKVVCVPGLLFADDTSLLASDLRKTLHILVQWCKEWGVKINVGVKPGIMHNRKKNEIRSEIRYVYMHSRW